MTVITVQTTIVTPTTITIITTAFTIATTSMPYSYYYLEVVHNHNKRLQNREETILYFTITCGYHQSARRHVHKCSCIH